MKSFAVAAAFATLFVASSDAATPGRRRTQTQHKSLNKASATYDPYLGISEQRGLEGHEDHGSMSMSMDHDDHDHGTDKEPDTPVTAPTETKDDADPADPAADVSSACTLAFGTAVSSLAIAGAMALL